jgi:hypothetical protein
MSACLGSLGAPRGRRHATRRKLLAVPPISVGQKAQSGSQGILTASALTNPSGESLAGNTAFTSLPKAKGVSG